MFDQPGTGGTGNAFDGEGRFDIAFIAVGVNKLRLQAGVVKHRPGIDLGRLALIRTFGQFGAVAVVTF